jgi:hypothetical protein
VIFEDVGRLVAVVTNRWRLDPDGSRTYVSELSEDDSFNGRWDRFATGGYAMDAICAYLASH